jgi:lysophospholipase L1-like esterase
MSDKAHPPSTRLLFIGDSITDCARRDQHAPLGCGYVRLVADMLKLQAPDKAINVINRGINGNTIDDLRSRWTDHVLCEAPDWLIIKIGINDCNRYVSDAEAHPKQSPQQFAEIYDLILTRTRESLPATQILVVSPFYLSKDKQYPDAYRAKVRGELNHYIHAAQVAAEKHNTHYLDLNTKFTQLLKHLNPNDLSEDAVHPNSMGTLFIAQHVFTALSEAQLVEQ